MDFQYINDRDYKGAKVFQESYALRFHKIVSQYSVLVYDRNHYFGLGPIPKPKPKLADTFGQYCNRYQNYILKGESIYR